MPHHETKNYAEDFVMTYIENESITFQEYILIVFILDMSMSMGRRSVVFVASFFSRRDASNDARDNPNGPI